MLPTGQVCKRKDHPLRCFWAVVRKQAAHLEAHPVVPGSALHLPAPGSSSSHGLWPPSPAPRSPSPKARLPKAPGGREPGMRLWQSPWRIPAPSPLREASSSQARPCFHGELASASSPALTGLWTQRYCLGSIGIALPCRRPGHQQAARLSALTRPRDRPHTTALQTHFRKPTGVWGEAAEHGHVSHLK